MHRVRFAWPRPLSPARPEAVRDLPQAIDVQTRGPRHDSEMSVGGPRGWRGPPMLDEMAGGQVGSAQAPAVLIGTIGTDGLARSRRCGKSLTVTPTRCVCSLCVETI